MPVRRYDLQKHEVGPPEVVVCRLPDPEIGRGTQAAENPMDGRLMDHCHYETLVDMRRVHLGGREEIYTAFIDRKQFWVR